MKYWRMAMREGTLGRDRFPDCRTKGIAALDYWDEHGRRIVTDCRRLTEEQYEALWRAKDPHNSSMRASLRHLWRDMKKDDVIYAKTGTKVVGKGRIVAEYSYNPKILAGTPGGQGWGHFVQVAWEPDFEAFECRLTAPLFTVRLLEGKELRRVQERERDSHARQRKVRNRQVELPEEALPEDLAAVEGRTRQLVVQHRTRERRLRNAKIRQVLGDHGKLECEVPGCGFDFAETYGDLGHEYAHVHHKKPIGQREGPSKTKLTDLAIVCANCHAMIHKDGQCRPLKGLIPRRGAV